MSERVSVSELYVLQERFNERRGFSDAWYYTVASAARDGYAEACQSRRDVRLIKRTITEEVINDA